MKRQIKKWVIRLALTAGFIAGLLLVIILNPGLTYANKRIYKNYTIYYNKRYDSLLHFHLDEANELLKKSEFYNPTLKLDICLNDDDIYPQLMDKLLGQSFASGFYNKVVLHGNLNASKNFVERNGYKWNLTELLAHEVTHCLQFDRLGLWKSSPMGNIPPWKKEGYPEYIARQNADQAEIYKNITRMNEAIQKDKDEWGISFADNTFVGKLYYSWWIQMQYCMDIKKMTYLEVLNDTTSQESIKKEMMHWYNNN